MKKGMLLIFLASIAIGVSAEDFSNLENGMDESEVSDSTLLISKNDTTLSLLASNTETENRDDQLFKTRLNYYKPLSFTASATSNDAYSFPSKTTYNTSGVNYKPLDDMSWVGVPIFLAGIIAKTEKEAFRQDYRNTHFKTRLLTSFKTHIDDYSQFLSPALTLGLKAGGVEGRSDWQRMMVSAAMSYGLMAGFVNGIKYTASEMRPDGSTANSWPSGHTATAFVGATILHKEYGLTRSPWYSIIGYGTATATGIMRVLNNRHWVSDVLSGAGIGIVSGELAYLFSDLIYKDRHLLRGQFTTYPDMSRKHPSFFDVSMGIGLGGKDFDFSEAAEDLGDPKDIKLHFRSATVVQAEGAYFLNNFIGIGGRLRVRSSPIKGWSDFMLVAEQDTQENIEDLIDIETNHPGSVTGKISDIIETREFSIESDHLTEFAGDVGLYFNIPISNRLALGSKALIGRSIMQALDIDAKFTGKVKGVNYDVSVKDGEVVKLTNINFYDKGVNYEKEWDFVTVSGNNSTKWGTGISLTYAYNGNFCWKVFCDYDYTRKTYTLTYNPSEFMFDACSGLVSLAMLNNVKVGDIDYKVKKDMHQFVIGASFSIQF